MQNMAEAGQLHKSTLASLFAAAKKGRKRRSSLWRRPLRHSTYAMSLMFNGPRVVRERKQRSTQEPGLSEFQRAPCKRARQLPGFAELVIGRPTSSRTRWLNLGYVTTRCAAQRCLKPKPG